jgi:hypothetical protein
LVLDLYLIFGFFVFWSFLQAGAALTQPDERGYVPDDDPHRPPPLPPQRPEPPPIPRPVVALDYGHAVDPVERRRARRKTLGRMALGCVGYIGVSIAWFGLAGSIIARGSSNRPVGSARYDLLFLGWAAMTLALLGLTLYLRLRYRIKGYGYGILTALGLVFVGIPLLIIGICFYAK